MAERPLRVVLVDDHEVVRDGIKALLAGADDVVVAGEAGSVRESAPSVRPRRC
jgi:DNA-binding NarL/FixJ family response regulator